MASWLSGLSPVRAFPAYNGPYEVGTVDVEIPAADVPAPSEAPEGAQPTIAFRMFYPCAKPAKNETERPVHWIPQPQRLTAASVLKYVGIGEKTAGAASFLLRQLYWIKLPAYRNAKLLDPPASSGRWPVTFFSHGLAGSRNAYSQICGDLASYGMVVIALDHRDGSSPIQYVRATSTTEAHTVEPISIPHSPMTDKVYEARDNQLRTRIWEISMAYETLVKIDKGHNIENLDDNTGRKQKERTEVLWQFNDMLDIHKPGRVSWAGHSFGAATMVQLQKSIFYYKDRTENDGRPLITPNADAALIQQIAPESPLLLLDMWCTVLRSPQQAYLFDRPLPSYATGGPNGANVLSVLSESFQNWKDNLNLNKTIIAKPSQSRRPSAIPTITREKGKLLPAFARLGTRSPSDSGYASSASSSRGSSPGLKKQQSRGSDLSTPSKTSSAKSSPERTSERTPGPHIFYVAMSQHFNQSDYGVLFPWLSKKFAKAEEPERCLELNVRAMVQVVRESGIEVGRGDDKEILQTEAGIRAWVPVAVSEEDEKLINSPVALGAVNRKLSITSTKSAGQDIGSPLKSPTGSMTGGQKRESQLHGMAALELPASAT